MAGELAGPRRFLASLIVSSLLLGIHPGAAQEEDTTPPSLTSFDDAPDPFHPKRDRDTQFEDKTVVSVIGLSETAYVQLVVLKQGTSDVVRRLPEKLMEGTGEGNSGFVEWNGRKKSGRLVPEGTYDYLLRLRDEAGNTTKTHRQTMTISWKVIRKRELHRGRDGEDFDSKYADGAECASGGTYVSKAESEWEHGVLLSVSNCEANAVEEAGVAYVFSLPRAYGTWDVTVGVYGWDRSGDDYYLHWRHAGSGNREGVNGRRTQHYFEEVIHAKRYERGRQITVTLFIHAGFGGHKYDIRDVSIDVEYLVLVYD